MRADPSRNLLSPATIRPARPCPVRSRRTVIDNAHRVSPTPPPAHQLGALHDRVVPPDGTVSGRPSHRSGTTNPARRTTSGRRAATPVERRGSSSNGSSSTPCAWCPSSMYGGHCSTSNARTSSARSSRFASVSLRYDVAAVRDPAACAACGSRRRSRSGCPMSGSRCRRRRAVRDAGRCHGLCL